MLTKIDNNAFLFVVKKHADLYKNILLINKASICKRNIPNLPSQIY